MISNTKYEIKIDFDDIPYKTIKDVVYDKFIKQHLFFTIYDIIDMRSHWGPGVFGILFFVLSTLFDIIRKNPSDYIPYDIIGFVRYHRYHRQSESMISTIILFRISKVCGISYVPKTLRRCKSYTLSYITSV